MNPNKCPFLSRFFAEHVNRTIYRAVYKPTGETNYIIIQVDEFALACYNKYVSEDIYNQIWYTLQLSRESDKPFTHLSLVIDFNGIDIEQSREYIQIPCHNHIYKVMRYHCWNEENSKVPATPPSPLPPDSLKQSFSHSGPK